MTLKIGLKYCSDCNPKYDRTAKMRYIMDALGSRVEFVNYQDVDADYILLVTSCDAGCAEVSESEGEKTRIITTIDDAEKFVCEISE